MQTPLYIKNVIGNIVTLIVGRIQEYFILQSSESSFDDLREFLFRVEYAIDNS